MKLLSLNRGAVHGYRCDDYEACEQRVAQLKTCDSSLRDIRDAMESTQASLNRAYPT
jgi:3-methyladenine DNA glycosylase/8-oxoguanine DNA glycosylase